MHNDVMIIFELRASTYIIYFYFDL